MPATGFQGYFSPAPMTANQSNFWLPPQPPSCQQNLPQLPPNYMNEKYVPNNLNENKTNVNFGRSLSRSLSDKRHSCLGQHDERGSYESDEDKLGDTDQNQSLEQDHESSSERDRYNKKRSGEQCKIRSRKRDDKISHERDQKRSRDEKKHVNMIKKNHVNIIQKNQINRSKKVP